MKLALFCIGGQTSGNGHIYRSKLLRNNFIRNDIKSDLFILKDSFSGKINLKNLNRILKKIFNYQYKYIFIDCSSKSILKSYKGIKTKLSNYIKKTKSKIILIDALGKESLKIKASLIYKKIIPYLNNSNLKFSGKKFIMINPEFKKVKIKDNTGKKIKILATFGSVDYKYTKLLLNYLVNQSNDLEKKIEIKIIIGLFCKANFYKELNSIIKKRKGEKKFIKIFKNQKSLVKHFKWSDLVITNDGLTKYESMLSGRCTVVLKKKNYNDSHSSVLKKLKISKYINLDLKKMDINKFEKEIFKIIFNKNLLKFGIKARNYFFENNFKNYLQLIK